MHQLDDEYSELRMRDVQQWKKASETIQTTLRQAAMTAFNMQLIDRLQADKYFISGTSSSNLGPGFRKIL